MSIFKNLKEGILYQKGNFSIKKVSFPSKEEGKGNIDLIEYKTTKTKWRKDLGLNVVQENKVYLTEDTYNDMISVLAK